MLCHTCGGKGHFKRNCPNRKVMFINEDNEYETGDDVDPNAPDDDDYDTMVKMHILLMLAPLSPRALNVLPSASSQRCNLFQTKALVGPDKACKVIIDGGSCHNLASKELCTKLKLKYLPHPHPYYIQWLSDNGEMKEFCDVFPEEVPAGLPPLRGPIFARSFQKTEEITSGATRQPGVAGAAQALAAPTCPLGPSCGPALTFRLPKPPSRNPVRGRYGKPSRDAAAANPISGIREIASGTLLERGFISRRTLHRHGRLRSDE
ncbi:hypothetical protein QYE76_058477 [Lolium multiflorum]|uniref:CCHC-type domain-containing protein n=1 Tax=Lolium multiflorum TaxID=4521 RepID=A0AAD8T5K9_LOLMU|nr:hypothetical protein QYE76_058477 [Lolium multiflorum]